MKKLQILDTTLRDGEQAAGMALEPQVKARIASVLDELGVDIIELGFPAASKKDFLAVKLACGHVKDACVSAFARLKKSDMETAHKALDFKGRTMIHFTAPVSAAALERKMNIKPRELIRLASECVREAKNNFSLVEIGAEDALRADAAFLSEFCIAVSESGADIINIADTTGFASPAETANAISGLIKELPSVQFGSTILSVHCHNDIGMALANTIAGIEAGAEQAEVTLLGIGERAGNAALEELCAYYKVKGGRYLNIKNKNLGIALKEASVAFCAPPPAAKAVIGMNAFSHASGMHQKDIIKNKCSYEVIDPDCFGIEGGGIVLGRHSGRAGVRFAAMQLLGRELSAEEAELIHEKIKQMPKKSLSVTDVLVMLKENGIRPAEFSEAVSMTVKESNGIYKAEAAAMTSDGKTVRSAAENVNAFSAVFEASGAAMYGKCEVKYYDLRSAGSSDSADVSFYLEAECGGKLYRTNVFHKDVYLAAFSAYADICNTAAVKAANGGKFEDHGKESA